MPFHDGDRAETLRFAAEQDVKDEVADINCCNLRKVIFTHSQDLVPACGTMRR
jgi:hypothetical protein